MHTLLVNEQNDIYIIYIYMYTLLVNEQFYYSIYVRYMNSLNEYLNQL